MVTRSTVAPERPEVPRRRRAPSRVGKRTTLTLPTEVLDAARALADERDTSVNDAVVQLALAGAGRRAQEEELARRARERRRALTQLEASEGGEHPSPEEIREAVASSRLDEDGA